MACLNTNAESTVPLAAVAEVNALQVTVDCACVVGPPVLIREVLMQHIQLLDILPFRRDVEGKPMVELAS